MRQAKWNFRPYSQEINTHLITMGYPPLLGKILAHRFTDNDKDQLKKYLSRSIIDLIHPSQFDQMKQACELIMKVIEHKSPILISGDYDVDGMTSTALLTQVLQALGAEVHSFIPNRFIHGYGFSESAIEKAEKLHIPLIITVDTGIKSIESVQLCKKKNIQVIITDHHLPGEELPEADAIINPNSLGESYPDKGLAGVGVAFKLAWALWEKAGKEIDLTTLSPLNRLLDLVAIGTIADIAPLTGENRIMVYHGLKHLPNTKNIGVKALATVSNVNLRFAAPYHIGFQLGPRLNAGGRLQHALMGVELLLTKNQQKAMQIAEELDSLNEERREIERKTCEEIISHIENEYPEHIPHGLFFHSKDWHEGVVGIAASRIVEKYHRPSFIGIEKDGIVKGSARGIPNFNVVQALDACQDLLEGYGGHKYAAGFSMKTENAAAFKARLIEYCNQNLEESDLIAELNIDCSVSPEELKPEMLKLLKKIEPFGVGNPQPVFHFKNPEVVEPVRWFKQTHLQFHVKTDKETIPAIYFQAPKPIDVRQIKEIIFQPGTSKYADLQLVIKDMSDEEEKLE